MQNTEHRIKNTKHRTQNTEYGINQTEQHRIQIRTIYTYILFNYKLISTVIINITFKKKIILTELYNNIM